MEVGITYGQMELWPIIFGLKNNGFWYYFDKNGKMVGDSVDIGHRKYDFTAPAIIVSQELANSEFKADTTVLNKN